MSKEFEMDHKHTPGNWSRGKVGGTVVSDQPIPGYNINRGHDAASYYGGHLIAESIWRAADARHIAAIPKMIAALETIAAGNTDPDQMVEMAKAALSEIGEG